MSQNKVYTAIGLMSGTSLDGEIDVALIRTDGHDFVEVIDFKPFPYEKSVRDKVRACFGKRKRDTQTDEAEALVTDLHIRAVKSSGFQADLIGFHGQTITHAPEDGFTWQLGDGERLAKETGMDVVYDMRQADIKAGGQGAPLIPLYHKALVARQDQPVAVLNLGGVANMTYIYDDQIMAFDTGPANALIDDYMIAQFDLPFDQGGQIAEAGKADRNFIDQFLSDPYFKKDPPKSLDRDHFAALLNGLPDNKDDAVATLTVMSAAAVMAAVKHFPKPPFHIYVCGGGRHNDFLMRCIKDMMMPCKVEAIEALGHNGAATEAEGFAYLAVRSLLGLPLTLPSTTGVKAPLTGGKLAKASS